MEASLLFDAARLGLTELAGDQLGRLAAHHHSITVIPILARTVDALTQGDPTLCEASVERLERLGLLLAAAELATVTHRLYAAAGHRLRASAVLVRAQRLWLGCEGARTPLLDTSAARTVLTRRELQVVQMVVKGLSDRAVAARLGLELRTVNNHLSRAYAKLGISGRGELAAVLSRGLAATAN